MKAKHVAGFRLEAQATLKNMNIALGQDFHTLSLDQVDKLVAEAARVGYRKPKNANGSTARYFHDRLQRHATMKDKN